MMEEYNIPRQMQTFEAKRSQDTRTVMEKTQYFPFGEVLGVCMTVVLSELSNVK
jgi:hypothetical protein